MMRLVAPVVAGIIFLASSSSFLCAISWAGLGEKESSVDSDARDLSGLAGAIRIHSSFGTKDITSDSVAVREYVGPDGTVFGLSWKGRNHPDFSALFGSYYSDFQDANQRRQSSGPQIRGSRRTLQGSHLVVERFGHMGALRGRAYVPSLLPAGVSPDEIK